MRRASRGSGDLARSPVPPPATLAPLDGRDEESILADLLAVRPGYVPEWRPDSNGPGRALVVVLARYAELVARALDAAPGKAFLAFLRALGIGLLPPRSARAPLVFSVADGSPIDPPLPAGSEVAVAAAPSLPSLTGMTAATPPEPTIFATTESIALVRARLASLHARFPAADQLADYVGSLTAGFRLFDDLRPVDHVIFLGHDTLFALQGEAAVTIEVGTAIPPASTVAQAGKPEDIRLRWEYLAKDGWLSFDPVEDMARGLAADGQVLLHKSCGKDASRGSVHGVDSHWIRGRVQSALPLGDGTGRTLPWLETLRARVALLHDELAPDDAFADGRRLDTSKDFLPFGAQPGLATTFYLACKEAFSRPGSRIQIDASFSQPGVAANGLALIWEYAATGGWKPLTNEFVDRTAMFTKDPGDLAAIAFARPDDWSETTVNGTKGFWMRARISNGSYGGPVTYAVTNGTVTPQNAPTPPIISSLSLGYSYDTGPIVPSHVLTLNGFGYDDVTEAVRWGRSPFQPFRPLDDRLPAVYFGFDRSLPVGLVSLFVSVPEAGEAETPPDVPPLDWGYLSTAGWADLDVLDETAGFQTSGVLQFVGQPDAATAPGPGGELYWIRAAFREGAEPAPLPIDAVHLNAVWATQHRTVVGEVVGRSDGSPHLSLLLQHPPVLDGERVEVQEWRGAGREWESLFGDVAPDRLRYDRDGRGNVVAVWVRWDGHPYLYSSAPGDRHYTLERTTGLLQFGDGLLGRIPPPGTAIAARYDYGGGTAGNVPAGTITALHSPVPFVQAVTNPVPAGGGSDTELVAATARRGPEHLRSLDRTLSASDYEWLAREASSEVAQVRCLPITGHDGRPQPGWVTLVIVPWSERARPVPSQALLQAVRDHVAARAPAAISAQIRVVAPSYRAVSVVGDVIVSEAGLATEVEDAVRTALDQFLHPLIGGPGGAGWGFGVGVALSEIAVVVSAVPGVAMVRHLELVSDALVAGDFLPVGPDELASPGTHRIAVRLGSSTAVTTGGRR